MIAAAGHADAEAVQRCLRGELVAEEMTTTGRELFVAWAHARGRTDAAVAARTGRTTYTAARIRQRLSLAAHRS